MDRELLLYRSECSMYKRDLPAHFAGDVFCIWPCSETLLYGKVSAIVKNQKPIKKLNITVFLWNLVFDVLAFSAIKFVQLYMTYMFCVPVVISCCCCSVLKKGRGIERIDFKKSFPVKEPVPTSLWNFYSNMIKTKWYVLHKSMQSMHLRSFLIVSLSFILSWFQISIIRQCNLINNREIKESRLGQNCTRHVIKFSL